MDKRFTWIEDTGLSIRYEDPGENYYGGMAMKLETPWIKLGELADYGRLYKIQMVGRYLSTQNTPLTSDVTGTCPR